MRLLVAELKKLFSREIFVLIVAAVFILNAYLMFRTASSEEATVSDYRAVYSAIDGMSDAEKLDWLDARLQEFSGQHRYDFDVLHELREECSGVLTYDEYLESIRGQAQSMTAVSIFAKPDTFNYRSIMKTPPAYENVQDVVPVFDVSKGLTIATDNSFTDILCSFILLFAVVSIMLYDREQGMSGLSKYIATSEIRCKQSEIDRAIDNGTKSAEEIRNDILRLAELKYKHCTYSDVNQKTEFLKSLIDNRNQLNIIDIGLLRSCVKRITVSHSCIIEAEFINGVIIKNETERSDDNGRSSECKDNSCQAASG